MYFPPPSLFVAGARYCVSVELAGNEILLLLNVRKCFIYSNKCLALRSLILWTEETQFCFTGIL
jgi:hypothetical protein